MTEGEALDGAVGASTQVAQGDGGVCSQQGCAPLHRAEGEATPPTTHKGDELWPDAEEAKREAQRRLEANRERMRAERYEQEKAASLAEEEQIRQRDALIALAISNPAEAARQIQARFLALLSKDELRQQYREVFKGGEIQPPKYMALRLAKRGVEQMREMVFQQARAAQHSTPQDAEQAKV